MPVPYLIPVWTIFGIFGDRADVRDHLEAVIHFASVFDQNLVFKLNEHTCHQNGTQMRDVTFRQSKCFYFGQLPIFRFRRYQQS